MVFDFTCNLLIPFFIGDPFSSLPSGLMWSVNPDCQMTLGNKRFAKEHSVAFDNSDSLGAKVRSNVLTGLNQPRKINMTIFPVRIICEMQQRTGCSRHIPRISVDPYILAVVLAFIKLEQLGQILGGFTFPGIGVA